MKIVRDHFRRLREDKRGSMVIETALLAPALAILSLGIYETSMIVARQHELQSAASEAEMIAIATNQGAVTNTDQIKGILKDSLDLTDENVAVVTRYRCGTSQYLRTSKDSCNGHDDHDDGYVSTYIRVTITDTYTPVWTGFGIGQDINFRVRRTIQVS